MTALKLQLLHQLQAGRLQLRQPSGGQHGATLLEHGGVLRQEAGHSEARKRHSEAESAQRLKARVVRRIFRSVQLGLRFEVRFWLLQYEGRMIIR